MNETQDKEEISQIELAVKAKEKNRLMLLTYPNVIGLDVGLRVRKGKKVKEYVVIVIVDKKIPRTALKREEILPSTLEIEGKEVGVDVVEGEVPIASVFTLRSRPVFGGMSIGPAGGGTGTLGVCVTLDDDNTYILSNNHVIADTDRLIRGSAILQPSPGDGGAGLQDIIARLSHIIPIDFSANAQNRVDCALAEIVSDFNASDRKIHWIGYPSPQSYTSAMLLRMILTIVQNGIKVHKMGRTTGYTVGKIISPVYDTFIDYSEQFGNLPGTNETFFIDQIRVEGDSKIWSAKGDSGSLVLEFSENIPVGLHFAGKGKYGVANHISDVMDILSIPRI